LAAGDIQCERALTSLRLRMCLNHNESCEEACRIVRAKEAFGERFLRGFTSQYSGADDVGAILNSYA